MSGRGMLDQDFDFSEDDDVEDKGFFKPDDLNEQPPKKTEEDLTVEVVDDTPEQDRGKWTADKQSTDAAEDDEDEQTKYSRRVKERIAKETAKVHAERRAKEERERQLQEAVTIAQKLIAENNQLKGLIESGEKVLMTESSGRIDGQIAAAKFALREAHEAGDINGQIAAQENLAKLIAEKDRISQHRPMPLPRMEERALQRFTAPQQPQQVQPDPEALRWQEKNKWFSRDEAMTAYALGLHSQLVNREGILPSDGKEYYDRIDSEMRKRFPERFGRDAAPRRTDTVVAPAVRSNGGKVTRKVTLTESQARLARRLGLTLEQYAQQVAAENGEKEWTHGFKTR